MTGSAANWQDGVIDNVCEKLFFALKGKGTSVRDAFCVFDVDNDGKIEYEEFINTLKTMDVGLSEAQIYELMRGMDKNKDSVIDLEEFTSRFGVIFTGYVDRENVSRVVGVDLSATRDGHWFCRRSDWLILYFINRRKQEDCRRSIVIFWM